MNIVFENLSFQACRLSKRSSDFGGIHSCSAILCGGNADAYSLSAARVCPVSTQIAQRHEMMVSFNLTHPSCFSKHAFLFFPLGAATTVTPAWIALFVWLSRYPRRHEPLGAVITDYECPTNDFVAVAVCSDLETQTQLMSSSFFLQRGLRRESDALCSLSRREKLNPAGAARH